MWWGRGSGKQLIPDNKAAAATGDVGVGGVVGRMWRRQQLAESLEKSAAASTMKEAGEGWMWEANVPPTSGSGGREGECVRVRHVSAP